MISSYEAATMPSYSLYQYNIYIKLINIKKLMSLTKTVE